LAFQREATSEFEGHIPYFRLLREELRYVSPEFPPNP